ncbi:hypothetical protein [Sulfoacidibacillus ferrooxidans]|uniref:Uncharacterized protein n=1 Tax=Sulfoacidibacillus ferrooxidans TaxID=2005001 RepID=A0A9X1VAW7_9BACL|nr:hypothetical protein [Sulfoacidibacillus ferrooxidans]MCI0184638.1 hypothetical protein [Sulfoacidibacillus ferrooxidans]
MGQLRSTQAILYGMQMAMLEERIRLDKESLKKIAYIPHPRQYPMEQAIIVGFAQACLSIGEEEEVWQISGVKGAFETVHIEAVSTESSTKGKFSGNTNHAETREHSCDEVYC